LGEHQLDKLGVTGSSPVPPITGTRRKRRVSSSITRRCSVANRFWWKRIWKSHAGRAAFRTMSVSSRWCRPERGALTAQLRERFPHLGELVPDRLRLVDG